VLLIAKVRVPPFVLDGFTTPLSAALNDGLLLDPVVEPLLGLELPLEHAARPRPASTAHVATMRVLRLLIMRRVSFHNEFGDRVSETGG
jgi:hypothetical protein